MVTFTDSDLAFGQARDRRPLAVAEQATPSRFAKAAALAPRGERHHPIEIVGVERRLIRWGRGH